MNVFPANKKEWWFALARILWTMGICLLLLGSIADFVPGAEEEWFWFCTLFLAFGLISRSRIQMIIALILIGFAINGAIQGRKHGIRYRAWLKEAHPDSYRKMYGNQ